MATELIINASLPETRIALMENGEIQDLLIERASGKGIVGNIYKGRVTRVLPGMQAAFVDIGLEKAAFLYVDDVYVHSEVWEEQEEAPQPSPISEITGESAEGAEAAAASSEAGAETSAESESAEGSAGKGGQEAMASDGDVPAPVGELEPHPAELAPDQSDAVEWIENEPFSEEDEEDFEEGPEGDDDEDEDDEGEPVRMGPGGDSGDGGSDRPEGTVGPETPPSTSMQSESSGNRDSVPVDPSGGSEPGMTTAAESQGGAPRGEGDRGGLGREGRDSRGRRHRRGRRGGRYRNRRDRDRDSRDQRHAKGGQQPQQNYPDNYVNEISDAGDSDSDRANLTEQGLSQPTGDMADAGGGRPETGGAGGMDRRPQPTNDRSQFRAFRSRDRRIRPKTMTRSVRGQVNIQDLLKEGQEVLVQVAKDPIATKGARLTCHISLPGRHLVCMPTIDHVGVSRRIERDDERRRLREYVDRNRPKNLGFIVRTASGKQSERRVKQDIEYLTRLWDEIREKAASVTAPALVYEDLNSILRAIRDWVTEDIDKIIVDSRYHFNDIQRFVSHFMPPLRQKAELYHGDIPIFDAYGISTELSRSLERKVWLKSGGYIVIDQAEALVAIDVNTGRYVGKKNLEDTILKTNLEAVQEIAYQLRLRNCGGIIILDLIDMEKEENKQRVYRALEDALKRDRARPTILKISELGLVEMTRKRTRDTIIRTLCESCAHCEGKGFIKSKQTVAYEVLREIEREGIEREVNKVLVQAHPDVIDILAIDERETLDQLERRYRKQIYLQAVTDFHPEQFEVTGDKPERKSAPDYNEKKQGGYESRSRRDRGDRERGDRDRGDRDRDRGDRDRQRNNNNIPAPLPVPNAENPGPVGESGEGTSEPQSAASGGEGNSAEGNNPGGSSRPAGGDEFYDEEDRLAFLRAQAAQDAALARLGGAGGPSSGNAGHARGGEKRDHRGGGGGGGGGRGGRNNKRGRRGGKFRGGRDRDRDRHSSRPYNGGGGGGGTAQPRGEAPANDSGSTSDAPSGGGGSDHSNPPV